MSKSAESAIEVFLKYFKPSLINGITKVQGDYKFIIHTSSTNYEKIKRIFTQINNNRLITISSKYIKLTSLDNKYSTERLFEITILSHNNVNKQSNHIFDAVRFIRDITSHRVLDHMSIEALKHQYDLHPREGDFYDAVNSEFNLFYYRSTELLNLIPDSSTRVLVCTILESIIKRGFYINELYLNINDQFALLVVNAIINSIGLDVSVYDDRFIILTNSDFLTVETVRILYSITTDTKLEYTLLHGLNASERLSTYLNLIDLQKID